MPRRVTRAATVDVAHDGWRLDQIAASVFGDFSRARLQGWIRSGDLRVDGAAMRPRDKIYEGAQLHLEVELERETSWAPQDLPLTILFEDEHILVVDKPAGIVVHPGAGNPNGTLVNALLAYRPDLETLPRGGIVHRLDKETSGLLVVAASPLAHRELVARLQRKDVQREYLAVVRGVPSGGGRVDEPLGRHPRQRTRMAVVPGGKNAVTHYRIAKRFAHYTALDVQLETGRTHQIRVHLAHRGYPLVGDPVYGGRLQLPRGCSEDLEAFLRGFRRQALHARRLSFAHPASGAALSFESPLADDLQTLLATLAKQDGGLMSSRPGA